MVHRFYEEFNIIPHYIGNTDKLKNDLERVILLRLGRVHYDYLEGLHDLTRDLSAKVVAPKIICHFNVIVGYGNTQLDCLYDLCIKLKDEIYDDIRSIFNEIYLRETE